MLDRVLTYAQEAAAGKPADAALGRYLMDALGGGAEESGKGGGFTSSLQVRPPGSDMEYTTRALILLLLSTGYANDVLLGQPRACTDRVIGAIGTGDGDLVKNVDTLYQELAVAIAHKIVTSLAADNCIVSKEQHLDHRYPTLPSRARGPYIFFSSRVDPTIP